MRFINDTFILTEQLVVQRAISLLYFIYIFRTRLKYNFTCIVYYFFYHFVIHCEVELILEPLMKITGRQWLQMISGVTHSPLWCIKL